jgi:mannose-6-phosphate isomerase
LIKLLDCAQWLSLQVHPDDEQAVALEGAGQFGKTEAWHVLEAVNGARLIAGLQPGVSQELLEEAIRGGTILDHSRYLDVKAGDTVFMPAGTIHALGPGLLIYEVQEASDWTYRVWDWGRPQTGTRLLHIEKSLAVARPDSAAGAFPSPALQDGGCALLTRCQYFTLELLAAESQAIHLDTRSETFHALTVIEGRAFVENDRESIPLAKFQTVLIPASLGEYRLRPDGPYRLLKASVEK